jgi:hypothetical protein
MAALVAAMLAAPGHAQQRRGGMGPLPARAPAPMVFSDPGEVVAAELAFARLARDKGQWHAFRATAAQGAQMFAPQPVRVEDFLKGRAEAPAGLVWQPYAVWSSCDGAYAVTQGVWHNGARQGWFATVWQRQRNGAYKWVLDQGGDLTKPAETPEMISARSADCPARRAPPHGEGRPARRPSGIPVEPFDKAHPTDFTSHAAPDGSLAWHTEVGGQGRTFTVSIRQGADMVEMLRLTDPASANGAG